MKKLFFMFVLLAMSSVTMAASIEINRLGKSANVASVNNLQMYQGGGRLDQVNLYSQSSLFPSTHPLSVGWRLSSDQDVSFTLATRTFGHYNNKLGQLGVNPNDWGVSLLNANRELIWSGNGLNFNINMNLKAGEDKIVRIFGLTTGVYQSLLKHKIKPLDSFKTQLWTYNQDFGEVSEVPLPAAVWLFGSALMGGLAIRRRSQKAKMTVA